MYTQLGLYIDGKWNHGNGGGGEEVINPATEKPLAHLPHASTSDLDAALAAAQKGFQVWKAKSAYDRARIIKKAADLVRERADHIARVMTQEQGKVSAEAKGEVMTSADIAEWFAEEGRRSYGRIIPSRNPTVRQMVVTEPVGVVAAFTPWNFPTLTPVRKISAALAAGCSIIVKASEETPGSCVELVKCFEDAGLPPGVLNLVFGVPAKVSEHLIASPIVRKISFTGSVPVGKHLAELAAKGMKRATMELGGHSPVIVFGDADPEKVGRHHLGLEVSQCRPGLHLADALLRAGGDLRPLPQALHRQRQGDQARRRAGEGHHHGAARQSAPARRDGLVRRGREEPRRQGRRPAARAAATRASSSSRP